MRKPKTSLTKLPAVPRNTGKVPKPLKPKMPSADALTRQGAKMRVPGGTRRGGLSAL